MPAVERSASGQDAAVAVSLSLPPLRIGAVTPASRFALAPMAGITDPPFRRLARRFGAGLTAAEMTTADTSLWRTRKSRQRLDFDGEPAPRVVQIAGSDAVSMAEAARALQDMGADVVDINMGCPAKKVCRKLAGSALLRDERLVGQILEAVVGAVEIPVTLKTRTGWDRDRINAPTVARIAESAGVAALALHGRTRACRYAGTAEYETIAKVRDVVDIPLFANGDIDTPEKALEVMQLTGVDGVMIGRAAQGRPWLFRDLIGFFNHGIRVEPLPKNYLRDIILGHLDDIYRFYGEATGVRVARKHLTWYAQQSLAANAYRYEVVRVRSASEQLRLTREFFDSDARLVA
ncbi:MAG: tRNA dihydrouridine synthase DusB [Pseudomonadota bacterium]